MSSSAVISANVRFTTDVLPIHESVVSSCRFTVHCTPDGESPGCYQAVAAIPVYEVDLRSGEDDFVTVSAMHVTRELAVVSFPVGSVATASVIIVTDAHVTIFVSGMLAGAPKFSDME